MSTGDLALALVALGALVIGLLATFSRKLEEWAGRFAAWRAARQSVNHFERRHGTVMSRPIKSRAVLGWSEPAEPAPVLRQQNQPVPAEPLSFDDVLDFLTSHNLDDDQMIDLLTVARREQGYLFSANKIRDAVGRSDGYVKPRVSAGRPKTEEADDPAPKKPAARLERPVNGWEA